MRSRTFALALVVTFGLAGAPAAADEAAPDPRWDRVAGLCRAWTAARFLHPGLWTSDVDWDAAFAAAAATTAADPAMSRDRYRAVAAEMLARLGDPATQVVDPRASGSPAAAAAGPAERGADIALARELAPGVFLLDLPGVYRARGAYAVRTELPAALAERLPAARGVVVDLRFGSDESYFGASALDGLAAQLVPAAVVVPGDRQIAHWGYAPEQGSSSGGYRSGVVTTPGREIVPAGAGGDWRFVFLADEQTLLPDVARALQAAGLARLVAEGPAAATGVERAPLELGDGLRALVRIAEPLLPPGTTLAPDVTVGEEEAAADPGAAVAAAERLLRDDWPPPGAAAGPEAGRDVRRMPSSYPEMKLPPPGYRLLAGCRVWGTIHHFYPYLGLIGDWHGAVREALPQLWSAADEKAYARAVLSLVAQVADGHTSAYGHPAIVELLGGAFPAVEVRQIEGAMVVTDFAPELASGLRVGDVVVSVDGEPFAARIDGLLPLTAASTPVARRVRAAYRALGGPAGSTAVLEVEGADGARRVEVPRQPKRWLAEPDGPAWRRVAPRVGYVDLRLLQVPEVGRMLDELRDTDAIVFDMRGYPNGTAWALAPRLNRLGARVGAQFRGRELTPRELWTTDSGYFFSQEIPEPKIVEWAATLAASTSCQTGRITLSPVCVSLTVRPSNSR